MTNRYLYGMHFRPAGMGATPKGHIGVEPHPAFRHGVIEYDHALTADEILSYELEPILSPKQTEACVDAATQEFAEYRDEWIELSVEDPHTFRQAVREALCRNMHGYAGDIETLVDKVERKVTS